MKNWVKNFLGTLGSYWKWLNLNVATWFSINRISYEEAIDIINKNEKLHPALYGKDLIPYHENILLDYFENQPVFITHFPTLLKPFYMKSDQDKVNYQLYTILTN